MSTVTLTSDANAKWRKNRSPRQPGQIDTCFYCSISYHPMLRWTHMEKPMICVCEWRLDDDGYRPHTECSDKARADGFLPRRDLTPRR